MKNPILSTLLDTDSYKLPQWLQYPPGTTGMMSYFESRGGRWPYTIFFGLQYYLKKYLTQRVTLDQVEEAKQFAEAHGEPFNYAGWKRIATTLKGKLPVKIKAVPEGSIIPVSNVLLTIESTDSESFFVVGWLETLLVRLWYPITVATNSYVVKQTIKQALESTSEAEDITPILNFSLHDFGSRGATSQESAMIAGAAHLVNVMGSDNIAGVWMANQYYDIPMAGFSIPASEHSTMSMWGKDNEREAFKNMIKQYGHLPIFACVSDTWDIYNAAENLWGGDLKSEVEKMNATLVVRPDSGDPVRVVLDLLSILGSKFGKVTNLKGKDVLKHVKIIQGDGNTPNVIAKTLQEMSLHGWAAENVAFGMGGGLLQTNLDRDTQKFAFKCCAATVNGKDIKVYKDPYHKEFGKTSKAGRLDLRVDKAGNVVTVQESFKGMTSLLHTVYEDGELVNTTTFDEVRERANKAPYNPYAMHLGGI